MTLRILAFRLKYLGDICGHCWVGECQRKGRSGGRQVGESRRAGDHEQDEFLRQAGQFCVSTRVSWGGGMTEVQQR